MVRVDANTRYVFFNSKTAAPLFQPADVDEYNMTCEKAALTTLTFTWMKRYYACAILIAACSYS